MNTKHKIQKLIIAREDQVYNTKKPTFRKRETSEGRQKAQKIIGCEAVCVFI